MGVDSSVLKVADALARELLVEIRREIPPDLLS